MYTYHSNHCKDLKDLYLLWKECPWGFVFPNLIATIMNHYYNNTVHTGIVHNFSCHAIQYFYSRVLNWHFRYECLRSVWNQQSHIWKMLFLEKPIQQRSRGTNWSIQLKCINKRNERGNAK